MSVRTDYVLKWPFSMNLSRAAFKPFRLEEFNTFDGNMFHPTRSDSINKKLMSRSNGKFIFVTSPALEAFPIVTQSMSSCSCFDVQLFFTFYNF